MPHSIDTADVRTARYNTRIEPDTLLGYFLGV